MVDHDPAPVPLPVPRSLPQPWWVLVVRSAVATARVMGGLLSVCVAAWLSVWLVREVFRQANTPPDIFAAITALAGLVATVVCMGAALVTSRRLARLPGCRIEDDIARHEAAHAVVAYRLEAHVISVEGLTERTLMLPPVQLANGMQSLLAALVAPQYLPTEIGGLGWSETDMDSINRCCTWLEVHEGRGRADILAEARQAAQDTLAAYPDDVETVAAALTRSWRGKLHHKDLAKLLGVEHVTVMPRPIRMVQRPEPSV